MLAQSESTAHALPVAESLAPFDEEQAANATMSKGKRHSVQGSNGRHRALARCVRVDSVRANVVVTVSSARFRVDQPVSDEALIFDPVPFSVGNWAVFERGAAPAPGHR